MRIVVVTGHYGSGKTEFSINYCIKMKGAYEKAALIDLDIANPYFRSRERQALLAQKGIAVYSNTFGRDITADLPAIAAAVRAPLEDKNTLAVVDAGGDESGARILNQFGKYFRGEALVLLVVNGNRPETKTPEGVAVHMDSIREETGLSIGGLVNNTHLLDETSIPDILKGHELCANVSKIFGIPVLWNCCREDLCAAFEKEAAPCAHKPPVFPLTLYMRATWMAAVRT